MMAAPPVEGMLERENVNLWKSRDVDRRRERCLRAGARPSRPSGTVGSDTGAGQPVASIMTRMAAALARIRPRRVLREGWILFRAARKRERWTRISGRAEKV